MTRLLSLYRQHFAEAVLSDRSRDFWREVRKINGKKSSQASVVDGNFSPQSIAQHFSNKYQELYNSVPFNAGELDDIRVSVRDSIYAKGFTSDFVVNVR